MVVECEQEPMGKPRGIIGCIWKRLPGRGLFEGEPGDENSTGWRTNSRVVPIVEEWVN